MSPLSRNPLARRSLLASAAALPLAGAVSAVPLTDRAGARRDPRRAPAPQGDPGWRGPLPDDTRDPEVTALERRYGVEVAFVARDLRTGRGVHHRAATRTPMCSTFKTLGVAAMLAGAGGPGWRVDLDRRVHYPPRDVLAYAPVTSQHVADGMTVAELCAASLQVSDNTAANLLLRDVGGPEGLTAWLRRVGDRTSRLDRWEPDLNTALPGDARDTTTAGALARTYADLLVGGTLDRAGRARLRTWMLGNTTSDDKFRATLPTGWRLADKTGSGSYGVSNDAGVAWRPDGTPVVVVALTRQDRADATTPPALLADLFALAVSRA